MYIVLKEFVFVFCLSLTVKALANRPAGYLGCYEDWWSRKRILRGKSRNSNSNSGEYCKNFCRTGGYRYAGTENAFECFCGHTIRIKISRDNCNHRCPGNSAEYCGGSWRIDIYDTWHCATKPCRNNAKCVDIGANKYTCVCSAGWIGRNCQRAKPSTTVRPSTTTTTTISTTTKKSSASTVTEASAENMTLSSTSNKRAINATDFPKIIKDGTEDSLTAMYVLLPTAAIVVLVATAVFIQSRRRYKDQVPEIVYHGTGSLPNIYANSTNPVGNQLGFEKKNTGNVSERSRPKMEFTCINNNTVGLSYLGKENEDSEYNVINSQFDNRQTDGQCSYDHIPISKRHLVDKTYSQLTTEKLQKGNTNMSEIYSNIENCFGPNEYDVTDDAENDDVTYNTLQLKGKSKTEKHKDNNGEESSEYDHTITGLAFPSFPAADDYSHINDVAVNRQRACSDSNVDLDLYINLQ